MVRTRHDLLWISITTNATLTDRFCNPSSWPSQFLLPLSLHVCPPFHLLEIHNLPIPSKSILRIPPVPLHRRLRPPSKPLLHPRLHASLERVHNLNSHGWHRHESHAGSAHGHHQARIPRVPINKEHSIRCIRVPAYPGETERAVCDLWHGFTQELPRPGLGFEWDLLACKWDRALAVRFGVVKEVAVAGVLIDKFELPSSGCWFLRRVRIRTIIRKGGRLACGSERGSSYHKKSAFNIEQHRQILPFRPLCVTHLNMR